MTWNWISLLKRVKAEYLFFRAQILGDNEKWQESVSAYERALAVNPTSWGVRLHYGLALARMFDYLGAKSQIQKAAELRPTNSVIPMFLGGVLVEQNSYEDALRSLDQSLRMDASNQLAFALKGLAHLYCGDREQGRDLLTKHYSGGPEWFDALLLLYCERICLGKGVNSLAAFESLTVDVTKRSHFWSNPRVVQARYCLSYSLDRVGIWISQMRPGNDAELRRCLLRGKMAINAGNLEKAKEELIKGTALMLPKKPVVLHALCSLLYVCDCFQEIRKILTQHSDALEKIDGLAILKARALVRLGKYTSALEFLKQSTQLARNDWWADFLSGICSVRIGDSSGALQYFRKAARDEHSLAKEQLSQVLTLCN